MNPSPVNANLIPAAVMLCLKQETAFLKQRERQQAERSRQRTQRLVNAMTASTAESRITAATARAWAVNAQIDEIAAQSQLAAALSPSAAGPAALTDIRIDDLHALFAILDQLPDWLRERIKKIHAKINWVTRRGKKAHFNVAVHKNHIPLDKSLTILAHLFNIPGDLEFGLNQKIESVIECGLYARIKRGKFTYGHRCQDGDDCDLCNYLNVSDGLLTLFAAYGARTFHKGGHWFTINVVPRLNRAEAKAVGRTLTPADWDFGNPDSAVYRESRQGRAFQYPDPLDDTSDWHIQSSIRRFLGAVQATLGKLVKNGWLDGVRARVENSVQFLRYTDHYHWHGVGSSKCEHEPQKMAEFIKEEVDAILATFCGGVYADVLVAVIPTPADLRRWVNYCNKPTNLVGAVASVYNRNPGLRRTDPVFKDFIAELRLYLQRNRVLFKGARLPVADEKSAHTYCLRRRYVCGNHKFGDGSILTESDRHRLYLKRHAEASAKRRAQK